MNSTVLEAPSMPCLLLHPQPLTPAAFAEFGEVIDSAGHSPIMINNGTTAQRRVITRWHRCNWTMTVMA